MSKTFNFPVWLKGSPEEQKAEEERQALAVASFSRAKLTDAERLIGRGKLLEETARLNLEASTGKNQEARILTQNQLADALAMQGRYAEAAETHTEADRRKYFRDVVHAIEMPDDEKCNCSDRKAKVDGVEIAITPRFERDKIFSPVHGEVVSLVECSKCGHSNARPLRSRLLKHISAESQNSAMIQGRNPRLISDVEILNADT